MKVQVKKKLHEALSGVHCMTATSSIMRHEAVDEVIHLTLRDYKILPPLMNRYRAIHDAKCDPLKLSPLCRCPFFKVMGVVIPWLGTST